MENGDGGGVGLENENSADPHAPDKLLALLSTTSTHIGNIEASSDAEALLKESLVSNFKTINDLLTDAITKGVSIEKAGELQLSESPIRLAKSLRNYLLHVALFEGNHVWVKFLFHIWCCTIVCIHDLLLFCLT